MTIIYTGVIVTRIQDKIQLIKIMQAAGESLEALPHMVLSSMHKPLDLSEMIAGGLLPTKQNFKTTISLPVICQNLRARFSYDFDFRDCLCDNQETT